MFFITNRKKFSSLFTFCLIIFSLILFFINIARISKAENSLVYDKQLKALESQSKIDSLFLEQLSLKPFFDPNIEMMTEGEKVLQLKEFRDKFVILYFFASWCTSCTEELKSLDKMVKELKFKDIKDIAIIPISEDFKSYDKVISLFHKLKIENLSLYTDSRKKAFSILNVKSLPTTFLVDKKGYIIFRTDHNLNWSDPYLLNKIISIKDGVDTMEEEQSAKNHYENSDSYGIIQNKQVENKTVILH